MLNLFLHAGLQLPNVMISANTLPVAGELYTLICNATVDEFLQANLILTWILPESANDTFIGLRSGNESSILSFNPLHTSHGGVYMCETTITISGNVLQTQTTDEFVTVRSKCPCMAST